MSMNRVFLQGNVGADPEIKSFDGGGKVAEFSLATSRKYRDRSEQLVEETEWHRCKVYGKRADTIEQYVTKGQELVVEGRIKYRSYEDKEGTTRYVTEIIVEDFHFTRGGNRSGEGGGAEQEEAPAKAAAKGGKKGKAKAAPVSDDDLPF